MITTVCFSDSKDPFRSHKDFVIYKDKDLHHDTSLITNIPGFLDCNNHALAPPSSLITALDTKINHLEKYLLIEYQRKQNESSRKLLLRDINL